MSKAPKVFRSSFLNCARAANSLSHLAQRGAHHPNITIADRHGSARLGEARLGEARLGKAGQGEAGRGSAGLGKAGQGEAGQGTYKNRKR